GDEKTDSTSLLLPFLLERVAATRDEKIQELVLSVAREENKEALIQRELAKILEARGAAGSLSNAVV
ncbi:hypothetical protein, partial [Methylicorpusculum sp.]|uniref:hypothetical protein n=1 Tax=Methylicorpusculum sp. TaxID=2713644 RepID=UPI002AB86324